MRQMAIAAAVLALTGFSAHAAGKVNVSESVTVSAPPAQVWEKIGQFGNLTWVPPVKGSEASNGDKPGSQRRLDLGGPILWEELVAYRPAAHTYTYKILDNGSNQKVLPVMHYRSTIAVKAAGQGSKVTWSSTFAPAPGSTAEAAQKAIAGVYRVGLDALAKDFAKN
jgi:mxaD protein